MWRCRCTLQTWRGAWKSSNTTSQRSRSPAVSSWCRTDFQSSLIFVYLLTDIAAFIDLLYISRSSAVRPTLQTLAPPSSPPHQPIFCCSSHSPDTCPPSSPPHQPIFCCSSHSPDTCPPSSPPHQPIFCCSSHSPDTCPPPIQSSTSADLLLFVPLSRHLPPHPVLHISRSSAVRPTLQTLAPYPVLHISRSSAARPTLQTLAPHPVLHISRSSAVRPTLQTLAPPSSPPHQPIFCCSSHSPDTCPPIQSSTSADLLLFVPLSRHLPPIQSSTSADLLLFVPLSRHLPPPHPVLHISRSSAVRPTLQTLAPIQSSTSADLLLFVPLSRHLPPHPVLHISRSSAVRPTLQTLAPPPPSSPPHQPIFCCSSHSPDTCPPIQSSTSADLLLFVPLSRHLPPHPVLHISRSSAVRPTLQTLAPPSSPPHQPIFCCSSHSPDTCPPPSSPPHPSPMISLAFTFPSSSNFSCFSPFSPLETISTSLWASLYHHLPVLSVHIFSVVVNPSPSRPPPSSLPRYDHVHNFSW